MNARTSLVVAALLVFAANAPAQQKKTDMTAKPAVAPAAAAKVTAPPAKDKDSVKATQSQSARAKGKKSGGQTEDDLYVGIK